MVLAHGLGEAAILPGFFAFLQEFQAMAAGLGAVGRRGGQDGGPAGQIKNGWGKTMMEGSASLMSLHAGCALNQVAPKNGPNCQSKRCAGPCLGTTGGRSGVMCGSIGGVCGTSMRGKMIGGIAGGTLGGERGLGLARTRCEPNQCCMWNMEPSS